MTRCMARGAVTLNSGAVALYTQLRSQVISFDTAMQQVLEIIEPGPLGGRLDRWHNHQRTAAAVKVADGLTNWCKIQGAGTNGCK